MPDSVAKGLNDNNSVKIVLLHLQALPATLKYSKATPVVRKRRQIIENPVPGVPRRHSKPCSDCFNVQRRGLGLVFFLNGRQPPPRPPGSPLATRGGGPVDTGATGPVARWGDQTEVLFGRVVVHEGGSGC
jgi:hypothetical protein